MTKQKQRIPLGDSSDQPFRSPFAGLAGRGSLPTEPALEAISTAPAKQHATLGKLLRKMRPTLRVERKGRGGKTVTLLGGLAELPDAALQDLAARLKKGLGCGVTLQSEGDAQLLLQGDQTERARLLLNTLR